ncbi:MAG: HAD-IIA family hydrolase [Haloarculaceae archaeon]
MRFEGAIVDLDGTVYRGDTLLDGAAAGIERLRAAGLEILFFSNNPTRTPAEYVDRLDEFGVDTSAASVLTSAVVTREYLLAEHPGASVYVVGEPGLTAQLDGLAVTDDPAAADVLVGSIDRSLDYDQLTAALRAARTGIDAFVGTDPDRIVPDGPADEDVLPGSGAVVGAIAATVGRDPDAVLGKPAPMAVDLAFDRLAAPPERCLVIGDRLDTDIALGERAGATTALVRTGMHDDADVSGAAVAPDHVIDSLDAVEGLL